MSIYAIQFRTLHLMCEASTYYDYVSLGWLVINDNSPLTCMLFWMFSLQESTLLIHFL